MKTIGTIVTVIMGIAAATVLRGYVVAKLWLWFVAATFGLPSLGLAQAAGIGLIVGFLTLPEVKKPRDGEPLTSAISFQVCMAFLIPPFALLVGWITKQCL
jgi:hypothetical protein